MKTATLLATLLVPFALAACSRQQRSAGRAASQPDEVGRGRTLTLLTYNVMAENFHVEQRVAALLKLLADSQADVIGLQEAWPAFRDRLLAEPWVKRNYHAATMPDRQSAYRGDYLISRWPIAEADFVALPSDEARGALVVRLRIDGRDFAIATTHMDSALESGAARARELDAIFALLKDADDAVLLGDLNFGDAADPESTHLDRRYVDLWPAVHPKDPGLTWNIERSDQARQFSFPGEKSRRLDRILVRSTAWRPRSIRIIGDTPIARIDGQDVFPSDHFGLVGVLERK